MLLTIHGILHLLGYDHVTPEQERQMFGLQRQLLLTFFALRQGAGAQATLPPARRMRSPNGTANTGPAAKRPNDGMMHHPTVSKVGVDEPWKQRLSR